MDLSTINYFVKETPGILYRDDTGISPYIPPSDMHLS